MAREGKRVELGASWPLRDDLDDDDAAMLRRVVRTELDSVYVLRPELLGLAPVAMLVDPCSEAIAHCGGEGLGERVGGLRVTHDAPPG